MKLEQCCCLKVNLFVLGFLIILISFVTDFCLKDGLPSQHSKFVLKNKLYSPANKFKFVFKSKFWRIESSTDKVLG